MFYIECKKELEGGFKIENTENFQCSDCAIREVEVNGIHQSLQLIIKHAQELNSKSVDGRQYQKLSEELKTGVREISFLCEFLCKHNKLLKRIK